MVWDPTFNVSTVGVRASLLQLYECRFPNFQHGIWWKYEIFHSFVNLACHFTQLLRLSSLPRKTYFYPQCHYEIVLPCHMECICIILYMEWAVGTTDLDLSQCLFHRRWTWLWYWLSTGSRRFKVACIRADTFHTLDPNFQDPWHGITETTGERFGLPAVTKRL